MNLEMDCLLVNPQWVRGIFSGEKQAEIRGNTNFPLDKWVGICETGSHIVYGAVKFSHAVKIKNDVEWETFRAWHKVDNDFCDVKYKSVYAWCISKVWQFVEPVRVVYKAGQVVWMKTPEIVEVFSHKNRVALLNKFCRECIEWKTQKHYF